MTIFAFVALVLSIFARAGGPEQLRKWLDRNEQPVEELRAIRAALKEAKDPT